MSEQAFLTAKIQQLEQEKATQRAIIDRNNYTHLKEAETMLKVQLEVKSLRSKLQRLEQDKATQREEIDRLKNIHNEDEEKISQLVKDKESFRITFQQLEQVKATQREEIQQAKSMHLKGEEKILQLMTDQKILEAKLQQLEQDKTALKEEIEKSNYIHLKDDETISQLICEQKLLRTKLHQLENGKATQSEKIKCDNLKDEEMLSGQDSSREKVVQVVAEMAATSEANFDDNSFLEKLAFSLVSEMESLRAVVKRLEEENCSLKQQIKIFNDMHIMVWGSDKDIQTLINKWGNDPEAVKHIAAYIPILKNELLYNIEARLELQAELNCLREKIIFYESVGPSSSKSYVTIPESTPGTSRDAIASNKARMLEDSDR